MGIPTDTGTKNTSAERTLRNLLLVPMTVHTRVRDNLRWGLKVIREKVLYKLGDSIEEILGALRRCHLRDQFEAAVATHLGREEFEDRSMRRVRDLIQHPRDPRELPNLLVKLQMGDC